MLEFALLGAIEVRRDGQRLDAGHPRQQAVLAYLLTMAGQPTPVDRLIDHLWGPTPPLSVRQTLHAHISRLRRVTGPDAPLRFASGCYVLEVEPDQVDLHRFNKLVNSAAEPARPATAQIELLREAMGLWRGEPLAGLAGDWAEQTRQAWYKRHADAAVTWSGAERRAGNPTAAVPLLTNLSSDHPLHEGLSVALMQALSAAGRPAEALAHYDTVRQLLQTDLGADPSPALREAHRVILLGEFVGASERPPERQRPAAPALPQRPAQLPAAPASFIGRDQDLAALDRWQAEVPVIAVVGPAGIGKTSLVLRWCWSVREQYPDGQLYIDLRGFGDGEPIEPADALDRLLRALDVPPEQIARDPDERSAQLRSHLAGRRVLLVLDNAASARQVRPLLPGQSGCLAVTTSRNRLDGLVAEGVRRLPLTALSRAESAALLRRIAVRSAGDDDRLTARLIELCEGLPLAVSVVAARLDGHHRLPAVVRELEDENSRLSLLSVPDDVSVRRALRFSVRSLDDTTQRLFALLPVHPGQTLGLSACAALLDSDGDGARLLLDRLAAVHLIQQPAQGRYRMHDLVRLVAREHGAGSAERDHALRRVLLWYRDAANTADHVLRPGERPNFTTPAPVAFGTAEEAMAWLDAEADNLTAAVLTGCRSVPEIGWQIAAAMYGWLVRRRHLERWIELYRVAADAAARVDDTRGEALIRGRLAIPYSQLGRNKEAADCCHRACELRRAGGDLLGAATALLNLGAVQNNARNSAEAIRWLGEAAELSASLTGSGHLRALIASNLGEAHALDGGFGQATRHYRTALSLARQHCGPRDVAEILRRLAEVSLAGGHAPPAVRYAEKAAEQARTAGDALLEAESLVELGHACVKLGRRAEADRHVRQALALCEPLDAARAATLRELRDRWAGEPLAQCAVGRRPQGSDKPRLAR